MTWIGRASCLALKLNGAPGRMLRAGWWSGGSSVRTATLAGSKQRSVQAVTESSVQNGESSDLLARKSFRMLTEALLVQGRETS